MEVTRIENTNSDLSPYTLAQVKNPEIVTPSSCGTILVYKEKAVFALFDKGDGTPSLPEEWSISKCTPLQPQKAEIIVKDDVGNVYVRVKRISPALSL